MICCIGASPPLLLALVKNTITGTSLEARAIRIAVWLLGHPSSSASPIPQLLRAHSTGSDGSSRSCSSSSSGSSDLLKDASSSLTPRPIVLAVVRALSAFLRTTTSTLRSDLKASAQEIFSYSGKSQSLGDGGGGCSGLKARDGNTNLGERKSAAAETLTAKSSDSSDTDVLPHLLVLPTNSVPSQLSSCPMSRPPLITEVGEDFVGDQNIPGDKKTDTVSNGDVRANAPTPEGKEQGMPPCILTAFARTPVTIQALVLVAAATPPSSTSSTSSSSSTTTTTNSSSNNGPTVLSSGASQCALCAAVALARIASQKPNENAESTSGSDGNGGGSGSTDGALISSSTTAVVEEEGSYRSLAIEAHWKALPALRQLLHVLRRWVGHPEPSRKRPWAIALDDLSEV